MLLPPAQTPEIAFLSSTTAEHQNSLSMRNTGRPSTAFVEYMERKKQGSLPSTPVPQQERPSTSNDTFQRVNPSSSRSRTQPRHSQLDQSFKRSISQQQQQQQQQQQLLLRPSSGVVRQQQASPESLHQTLRVAPAAPTTSSHSRQEQQQQQQQQQQQEVDYLSLTNAARSLAEAANSLANSLSPKVGKLDPGFQQAIADAAQDVAKNSALLSGLPPKSATQPLAPNSVPHVTQSHVGLPPRSQSAAPQGLPRTPSGWYDHTHNSAPGLVQWARSPEVGSTGNPLRPSSRASTPSSARVHAPKFPPVNPIVAMRATEPPPAYSVAYGASSYGGPGTPGASRLGTPLSRPYTANPITHTLDEGPRPATGVASRAGSTRGSTHGLASRTFPVNGRTSPGPGDAGSQASQVLSVPEGGVDADGEHPQQEQHQQRPETRAGPLADKEKEAFEFMFRHPERIRLSTWPPPDSYTESEIMRDDAAQRYNGALESMRYRLYTHGTKPMMNAFKIADSVRSGSLDTNEFKSVLANLEFGTTLDEKVLNEIVASTDKTSDGKVDYLGFITALRFNTLPSKPYDKKFKHRVAPNPDMPCGNPGISYPYGTLNDKHINDQKILNKMNWKHMDLRQAFEMMDSDADGYITYGEFKKAMKDLNERHNLRLNDEYISKAFREADWDFNRAIDYDEFLSTFAGSAGSRFVPEFMKPQSLRCSTLTAPWEDQRCHIMADTRRAQEAAALGLDSTAKSMHSRNGWRPGTSDKPATPLANESSRLLRSLS